jgi:predicted metal-dependent HD superfamily phosphohydrolase
MNSAGALDRSRWSDLWRRLGASGNGLKLFEQLASAYAEPARAYHNTGHILSCLAEFDHHRALALEPDEVEAALWFHDVIYDPMRSDNEERSAELALKELDRGGVGNERASRIGGLVLATRHTVPALEGDARLVCDIDLAILGSEPPVFKDFERRIRQEYRWVPGPTYRRSRSEVLRRFLLRSSIYQTPAFSAKYETQARQNLEGALVALAG